MENGDKTEILVAIARIEGKLDHLSSLSSEVMRRNSDHELRIRAVERGQWKNQGIAAVVAAGLATAISYVKFWG